MSYFSKIGVIGSLTLCGPGTGAAQGMPPSLVEFLRTTARFTLEEVASVDRGDPVVKVLATSDVREVALIAAIGIAAPRALSAEQAAALPPAGPKPVRIGTDFGRFGNPALPADVSGFVLPHNDVQELFRCQPGSCNVKLPGQAMSEMRAALRQAPDSADLLANDWIRRRMVEYVNGYRARGTKALVVYEDRMPATAAEQVWDAMRSRSPFVYQYAPALDHYLQSYPEGRPEGQLRETIFWALGNLPNLRRVLSITHQVVYSPPEPSDVTFIALRQLYSDHYLDGAFALIAVIDRANGAAADPTGSYLVALHRLHFDNLPSGGLIDIRAKVVDELRNRTREFLRQIRQSSERAYAEKRD